MVRSLEDLLAQKAREEADDRDLTSRSDARRERKQSEAEWAELAETLVGLTARQLGRIELPDRVLEAVLEARRIVTPVARARSLRQVRRELRAGGGESIRTQLRRLFEPGRAHVPTRGWPERLLAGGDPLLTELCQHELGLDRQKLRALVRNARQAKNEAQRRKAVKALETALGAVECPEDPVD
jgi:ribosome-associated protein